MEKKVQVDVKTLLNKIKIELKFFKKKKKKKKALKLVMVIQ